MLRGDIWGRAVGGAFENPMRLSMCDGQIETVIYI